MSKKLSLFFILVFFSSSKAQIKFDTVSSQIVGYGMRYYKIVAPSVPWSIDLFEADYKNNPFAKIMTVKANDRLAGYEKTSSMAARNSYAGHRVVAAINGDFYGSGGVPINAQVAGGVLLRTPIPLSTIGFNPQRKIMLERTSYSGWAIAKNSTNFISNINATRGENQLILYNKFFGTSTQTNQWGCEVLLNPITEWSVNDTIKFVAISKVDYVGNMAFSGNQAVLSGHGSARTFLLNNVNVGDTIKIILSLNPGISAIKELIGGFPRIVKNGINYAQQGFNEEGGPSHAFERHPRTAVGFNEDSTKVYFVTVDGRQSHSAGMTLPELADFMIKVGVAHGLNLDGGGSTTMVINGNIVNKPSDGTERSVANSLLFISLAPSGHLAYLQISPKYYKLFLNERIKFTVAAYDNYFNPITIDDNKLSFSLSHNFGTIDNAGNFTAGLKADTGYVYVTYEGLKDSALVIVKDISRISIRPKDVVIDTSRQLYFEIKGFDMDGILRTILISDCLFHIKDTSIVRMIAQNRFKGLREGETKIYANYKGRGILDSALVKVEIGEGETLLESFESFDNFAVAGENLDSLYYGIDNSYYSQGNGSLKLRYRIIGDPNKLNYIHLNCDYKIYGIPDSLFLDAKTNGLNHHITYKLWDDDDEIFDLNTLKYANSSLRFDKLPAAFSRASTQQSGAFFNYPVRIKRISIKVYTARKAGEIYAGEIYLDNLRVKYPAVFASAEREILADKDFVLYQNYPNPFNPSTKIIVELRRGASIKLEIYDSLGRKAETLYQGYLSAGRNEFIWKAENFSSGVYFYVIDFEGQKFAKKMVLIK